MMGVFALGGLASVAGAGYAVYLLGAWGVLGFVVFFLFLPIQVHVQHKNILCIIHRKTIIYLYVSIFHSILTLAIPKYQ